MRNVNVNMNFICNGWEFVYKNYIKLSDLYLDILDTNTGDSAIFDLFKHNLNRLCEDFMDHSCLEANMLNNCWTNLEDIEIFIYNNFSNQMESSEFLFSLI